MQKAASPSEHVEADTKKETPVQVKEILPAVGCSHCLSHLPSVSAGDLDVSLRTK